MASVTVTNDVPGLGGYGGGAPVRACGCTLCTSAADGGAVTAHAMAASLSVGGNGTRTAELIDQYRGADGFYHYSGDRNIDAVLIGSKWTGSTLTFSFPTDGDAYGTGYDFGQPLRHVEFNDAQKDAARAAFDLVAGYVNVAFVEVAPDSDERTTFRLSSSSLPAVGSAMGYFPNTPENLGGDIWFGRTQQPYYETPQAGNWGYATILHEIGHTLGLKHGHSDYTSEDLSSYFGTDRPLYGSRALEYNRDGQAWSLMSYTAAPDTINAFNGDGRNQPQTYMMYDIAALQYLYGANYSTNAGDSVYRWDPSSGTMSVNGVAQATPAGNTVLATIWDGGGNDTYDLSNYAGDLSIDLRPGALSTISQAQLANALGYVDGDAPMAGNIGNALLYEGNTASLIENGIGGAGNDRLTGNQASNRLDGGGGDDLIVGGRGNDLLIGGAGNDVADFSDATTGITIAFNNGGADMIVANGADRDVLRGVEGAIGTAFNDTLVGDRADNLLSGGAGGRDYLNGGLGNDTLIGATDTIVYEDKKDIIKDVDWFNQTMSAAIDLDGSFDLAAHALVEQAGVLPHATVRADGMAGGVDYYRFSATAGAAAIFDLDGVGADMTAIEVLDSFGNVVASNYGVERTDAGSRTGGAPLLDHVFQSTGIYYVRVGALSDAWSSDGIATPRAGDFYQDTSYVLNVSVEDARVDKVVTATGSGQFYGGAGDDLIFGATGNDVISGGTGADTLSYANARSRVAVDLAITVAQKTLGGGTDIIGGVENLVGSRFGDTLKGDTRDNVINGGGGNDRLVGGAGRDTLSFAGQEDATVFSLALQGIAQSVRLGETIVATGFEDLVGGDGNDVLTGDNGVNTIRGGDGDDVLAGNADGNPTGVDMLDGGKGIDTASFAATGSGVLVTMENGRGSARSASGAVLATFVGIEAVEGGYGDDTLVGDGGANRLSGGDGNDTLRGGRGDDALDGGWGDDVIDGGDGDDTAAYTGWGTHYVDLARLDAQDTGAGLDRLIGIENLRGGGGSDYLFGNDADNVFFDAGGNDLYGGRGGSDTVDYSTVTGTLTVDLSQSYQQDTRSAGFDLLDGIENLTGGDFDNVLKGTAGANRLIGGRGVDVLFGDIGADRLEGGEGDDLLVGDVGGRSEFSAGVSMNDVLIGGRGGDQLVGGEGDDMLQGGSGNDILIGGVAVIGQNSDRFTITSLVLTDGGQDTLDGGEGDDSGVLFYVGRSEAIRIDNRDTQATNMVLFDGVAHGSLTGIETLRFYGGDGDDRVETSAGYDIVQGGGGDDYLSTGQGDDTVSGNAGDDWMDGGEGMDTLSYAGATAGVVIDLRRTEAQDTGGAGIDTIRNFENVNPTQFTDLVYGSDESNTIRDYDGGDDTIYGFGGSDSLGVFRQYGQAAQTIFIDGGEGSDVVEYYSVPTYDRTVPLEFYRQTDTVTLLGGSGRDGIYMSGQKVGVIDAGEGDDEVTIGIGGLNESSLDITLGAGADVLVIGYTDNYLGEIDRFANVVRDFEAGDNGDRVDLTQVLGGWITRENPFAIDQFELLQVDDDVSLRVDMDRGADQFEWRTFLTFENTEVADFTAFNFFHVVGDGFFEPLEELPWDPNAGALASVGEVTVFDGISTDPLAEQAVHVMIA